MDILFNKTREQCRLIGARGGRAHARNLRLRQAPPPLPGASLPQPVPQNAIKPACSWTRTSLGWPRPSPRARPAPCASSNPFGGPRLWTAALAKGGTGSQAFA